MVLESLLAKGFRNLKGNDCKRELFIELCNGVNILQGGNAQGKTNFIEAVYFCATARSHRTNTHKELIGFDSDSAFLQAKVASKAIENPEAPIYHNRIDVLLKQSGKGIAVNGLQIDKLGDLFGMLYCVIFSPEDLSLIKSGPGERRRFMDMELCQISKVYYHELKQYYKILKQRNSLLKSLQKGRSANELDDILFAWDKQLADAGIKIFGYRKEYVEKISAISGGLHKSLAGGEVFSAVYKPSANPGDFLERLSKTREKDIFYGATSLGIHKDDITFYVNGLDSRIYSSQGQQRTAALSLKLAEVKIIEEEKNEPPVLLLDDVMSELDKHRQKSLLDTIKGIQTIISCTGVEDILYSKIKGRQDTKLFTVEKGQIFPA